MPYFKNRRMSEIQDIDIIRQQNGRTAEINSGQGLPPCICAT